MKIKTKINNKKLIFLIVIVLLLIASAIYFFIVKGDSEKNDKPWNQPGSINYDPPTGDEKKETEQFKKDLNKELNREQTAQSNLGQKRKVDPVITYSEQYENNVEVASYVSGVFEDGGECKIELKQGTHVVTRAVMGVKDATTTRCPIVVIAVKDLPNKGSWSATVSYNSSTATGLSKQVSFNVK